MPAAQASLIPELEDALRHISFDKRAETIRRVVDFFLAGIDRFSDSHIHLFDRVLGRLMVAVESKALAELAPRFAPLDKAPTDVVRRLAGDVDIAVAAPVLTRSRRLADVDLVAIARTRSQAHLLAISGRSVISNAVTDALVEWGDRDVLRNVALNQGAQLSPAGLAALVERAARDAVLAEKLAQRPDVLPDVLRSLVHKANAEVRERLATARPDLRTQIEQALPSDEIAAAGADFEVARSVRAMRQAGRLGEAEVLDFARRGRVKETIAALALICDVSADVVRRLVRGDQPDAALILCQAAGISWPAARAILQATTASAAANRLDQTLAEFDRLSPATAERIVGFWRACDNEWRQAS